jgi:hypothetical protein
LIGEDFKTVLAFALNLSNSKFFSSKNALTSDSERRLSGRLRKKIQNKELENILAKILSLSNNLRKIFEINVKLSLFDKIQVH